MKDILNYEGLGRRIRNKRKSLGFTQSKLAATVGLSVSFMGHVERGSRKASLETLVNICNALRIMPNDLLRDSIDSFQYDLNPPIEPPQDAFTAVRELIDKIETDYRKAPKK